MKKDRRDYREVFGARGSTDHYVNVTYAPGSFYDWVWQNEKAYLRDVIDRRLGGRAHRYLDFACGPGRVLAYVRPMVGEATGIDVSAEALARAAEQVPDARLVCGDVTADPSLLAGPYDLITSFRFFLHAQPELRDAVVAALRTTLPSGGLLIFNVHGNARSIRSLGLWYRRRIQGHPSMTLSVTEVERLVARHGLKIVETRGISLLPGPMFRATPRAAWDALERFTRRSRILQRFCTNVIYVCEA